MGERKPRRHLVLKILLVVLSLTALSYFAYFPGRQSILALSLASGIGIPRIQAHVDKLQTKAIKNEPFSPGDKRFLQDLYSCFAKGGRLTILIRQTGAIMAHYLSAKGTPYRTAPRIFLKSKPVQSRMAALKKKFLEDLDKTGKFRDEYVSATFYMPDPGFLDSKFGLYYGRLILRPERLPDGGIRLTWRPEVPWQWPTYESQIKESGDPHAKYSIIPNALVLLGGQRRGLRIDDGLGEYLVRLGLAKPFLLYSEWEEEMR